MSDEVLQEMTEIEKSKDRVKKPRTLPVRPEAIKSLTKGQIRILSLVASRYSNTEIEKFVGKKDWALRRWMKKVLDPVTRPEEMQECINWLQLRDMAGMDVFRLATPGGCIRQLEVLLEDVRAFMAEAKQEHDIRTFAILVDCARRCIGYAMSVQTKFGLTKEPPKTVESHQTLMIVQDNKSEITSRLLGLMDRSPIPGGALAQLPAPDRELVAVERKEPSADGTGN